MSISKYQINTRKNHHCQHEHEVNAILAEEVAAGCKTGREKHCYSKMIGSGPLGYVLRKDVEFTSDVCVSHVPSCSNWRSLHDDNLENVLLDGKNSRHDEPERIGARMKWCPNDVLGNQKLCGQRLQCVVTLRWCGVPMLKVVPVV